VGHGDKPRVRANRVEVRLHLGEITIATVERDRFGEVFNRGRDLACK